MLRKKASVFLLFFVFYCGLKAMELSVNSAWEFVLGDTLTMEQLNRASNWQSVHLPHTWNQLDPFDEPRGYHQGVGWYRKNCWIPEQGPSQLFLKFEGVNQVAELFVNGTSAGMHRGGYTAFVVDITPFVRFNESNDLVVRVDNRTVPEIPPLSADFTFFGGIYRDVWLIRREEVCFDITDGSTRGVYLSTPQVSQQSATLNIRANIRRTGGKHKNVKVTARVYDPNDQLVTSELLFSGRIKESEFKLVRNLTLSQPHLWSVDDPVLYRVQLTIEEAQKGLLLDQVVLHTGIRTIAMDENRTFYLNGKPLKLIGVNRHQDFPGLGNALTNPLHLTDMELIKAMGGNFVRLAHYPQAPAVLEACDRLGLLVWEEVPVVNYITVNEGFTNSSVQMMQEMVRQHYNHPSIIMWGLMNEILLRLEAGLKANPQLSRREYLNAVRDLATDLNQVAKLEDPLRWTAIAHHLNEPLYEEAQLNDITDVVGWNIYYGWYSADPEQAGGFLDRFHRKHPSKGIVVSEYGGDAVRNLHAVQPRRFDFSCEWQTALHASYLRQINARPHVMGATAWVFADFSSEGRKDAVPGMNNKGLLNYDRSPKDSYLLYQAALSRQPYLEIGSRGWRSRAGFANEQGFLREPVFILSNASRVELILNGESLGEYQVGDFYVRAEVPFSEGVNHLVVTTPEGVRREALFQATLYPENLSTLNSSQINIRMNVGAHFHWIDPVTREMWIPEREYRKNSLGFVDGKQLMTWNGFRVGTEVRINGSANEPVYQTHRDSITEFRADLPAGWYEVSLHLAEIYSSAVREKLAYNLGNEDDGAGVDVNRRFKVLANNRELLTIEGLRDFTATEYRFKVPVNADGLTIQFQPMQGSAILSGIAIKGL